ncbi:hypothetical protein DFH06DRAFT_1416930 [Mycena polygramma]|nr:hypothetical protein DFH06DRAFT_1416930 [Mycena polygramma]
MSSTSRSSSASAQSSASGSASSVASSISASGSASGTPTFFSQTFSTTPDSTPTFARPSGGGGGGGGGGQSGGDTGGQPGIQSSAQLYLYTFLATLILLLGVSSAIVVRSLLLRRRHRRLIAEAIANGTWVPPAPRVRVDLKKKPRLWDAWVVPPVLGGVAAGGVGGGGGGEEDGGGGGEKEKGEWDGIMVGAVSRFGSRFYSPLFPHPSTRNFVLSLRLTLSLPPPTLMLIPRVLTYVFCPSSLPRPFSLLIPPPRASLLPLHHRPPIPLSLISALPYLPSRSSIYPSLPPSIHRSPAPPVLAFLFYSRPSPS